MCVFNDSVFVEYITCLKNILKQC